VEQGGDMSFLENLVTGAAGGLLGLAGTSMTNAQNKEINEQNIAFQRETNAKNEALMRESWARDDNAVQRRAKDLAAAGMSPLLAEGSAAGNASVVSMSSPKSNQIVQKSGMEGAISGLYQGIMAQQSYMDMIARQQQVIINQGSLQLQQREQDNRDKAAKLSRELASIGLKYEDQIKLAQLYNQNIINESSTYNLSESKRRELRTNDTVDPWIKRIEGAANLASDAARGITKTVNTVNEKTGRNATLRDLFERSEYYRKGGK